MKKQLVILGLVVLLLVIGLSGCVDNQDERNKFVGTWKHESTYNTIIIVFFSNGTYETQGQPIYDVGSYGVKNGKISLSPSNTNLVLIYDYSFSNDNQKFTLVSENGSTITYTKQTD